MPRKTVLIVDDDWDILDAIKDILEGEGFEAVVTQNGQAGLDYLGDHPPPGVILLDWNMAPMNGAAFLAELALRPPSSGIPVVLLTADLRVESKANHGRFVDYLRKPVDLEKLIAIVGRYCAQPGD
jgi:CheY-like chemotaxis protein